MDKLAAIAFIFIAVASQARASHAQAGEQCQDDVARIDQALAGGALNGDVRGQVEELRSQAVQYCGAGNSEEGIAAAAEALALITKQ